MGIRSTRALVSLLLVGAVVTCPLECVHACTETSEPHTEVTPHGHDHGTAHHHDTAHPEPESGPSHAPTSDCADCADFLIGVKPSRRGPADLDGLDRPAAASVTLVAALSPRPTPLAAARAVRVSPPGDPPVYVSICSFLI